MSIMSGKDCSIIPIHKPQQSLDTVCAAVTRLRGTPLFSIAM